MTEQQKKVLCPGCGANSPLHIYDINFRGRLIDVGVCARCALGYQVHPLSEQAMVEYYRETSVFQESGTGSRQEMLNRVRYEFLDGLIDTIRSRTEKPLALDAGCGFGNFLGTLGNPWRRIGLELNPERADNARRVFGATVWEKTLEQAEIENSSVDFFSAFGVVEHLLDPHTFFRKAKNILHPDGFGMINVPDMDKPLVAISQFFTVEHNLYFTRAILAELLAVHGFRVVKIGRMTPDYPDITCIFENDPHATVREQLGENAEEANRIQAAMARYKQERDAYIQGILSRLKQAGVFSSPESLAVYGAGEHTRELCLLAPELNRVRIYFDANRSKWGTGFLGGTVHSPDDLESVGVTRVLISSKAFEREIARSLRERISGDIELFCIYDNLSQV